MPHFARSVVMTPSPFLRSISIAALIGATVLVSPLTRAHAGDTASGAMQLAQAGTTREQAKAGRGATQSSGETVEQRIADLQKALKITPDEDAKWNAVAQAMRENASNMDKLVAENRKTSPQSMSAVDDLKTYQKFAQQHVDGLKNLIASFETLYNAMPDAQKKIADDVFRTSERTSEKTTGRGSER